MRFLDSFTVSYQIQEESKTIPVYKLLLQPLVENALLHGLERKQEGGELIISSYLEEEYLVLSVQDNGDGINRERLDYIQQELGSLAQNKAAILHDMERTIQDLYGLRNVLIRLKMMYGPKADLQLESEEGVETRITLFIPLDSCKSEFIMDGKERLA
ncbi:sensor histidine kinase [Paenibacillus larvae]|uniref:sensor histidine kinase n=1 Tax=Paenibacillus larvae TaxID=1464 RepID=UPI0030839640